MKSRLVILLIVLPFFIIAFPSSAQSKCKVVKDRLATVVENYKNGQYIYASRLHKVVYVNRKPKITRWKKNKFIAGICKRTGIEAVVSGEGDYILTEEVIQRWEQWVEKNCN